MRFLIDGYNLLHAACKRNESWQRASFDAQRRKLLDVLAAGLRRNCKGATVVFDGVPGPGATPAPASLEVIYSGRGSDADQIIEDLIAEDSAPRLLTTVSSDRRIRSAARRRRAISVSSEDFLAWLEKRLVKRVRKPAEPASKFEGTSPEDRDFWQEVFDVEGLQAMVAEAERPTGRKESQSTRPSARQEEDDKLEDDEVEFWLKEFGFDGGGEKK